MIHSHARMRRSRAGSAWEGNQEGQGCPRHGPASWPHGPIPIPSTARGEQRGARSPPGSCWVGQGCGWDFGRLWALLGLDWIHQSQPCACGEGETEARPQCQAEGIAGKAPCGNQLDPKGPGSKKTGPRWILDIPWGSCQWILGKESLGDLHQGVQGLSRDQRKEGGAGFYPLPSPGAQGMQTPPAPCVAWRIPGLFPSLPAVFLAAAAAAGPAQSRAASTGQPPRRWHRPARRPGSGPGATPAPSGTPSTPCPDSQSSQGQPEPLIWGFSHETAALGAPGQELSSSCC